MRKDEKDKLKQYGRLVVDFANGKNTDQVLTDYIGNIQSAFNFSRHFKKRFLERLPTKEMCLGKLTKKEHDLFEMLLRKNEIFKSCDAALYNGYYHLKNYDSIEQIFTILEGHFEGGDGEYEYQTETFLIPKTEIETYIDMIQLDDRFTEGLKADLKRLTNFFDDIEEMKSQGIKSFPEIEKMAENYPPIDKTHDHIRKCQEKLIDVLSQIITNDKTPYDTEGFKSILSRYNTIQKQQTVLDNHTLKVIGPFNEVSFLEMNLTFYANKIFNEPISYCLVEFLKHPEYAGQKKIKKCDDDNCGIFFISTKNNPRQRYCPNCSKKNHTPQDIQKKRTKASREAARKRRERLKKKQLYNDQYKRLIDAGYPKKQAQQGAEEYVIEQLGVIE